MFFSYWCKKGFADLEKWFILEVIDGNTKYEQIVNLPKITFQNAFVRIFRKISAKMSPQSLYLCGFLEVRVEMKVAPFRALTQLFVLLILFLFFL